jgi:hypothetical protein
MADPNSGSKGQPEKRRQTSGSDFEDTSPSGANPRPRTSTVGSQPAVARTPTGAVPAQPLTSRTTTAAMPAAQAAAGPLSVAQGAVTPSGYQKKILASSFKANDRTQLDAMLGKTRAPVDDGDDEPTAVGLSFDGRTPAKGVTSRDVWKAINAPVQSREGRRSFKLYRLVIDQFAVGHNERYADDAPGKPRGHIFVWDVTRAMNAEVPHFSGAKELNLAQTVDWLRHEGPMRGWQRADAATAQGGANEGYPVLAIPKEIRLKLIAVVRPGELGTDGKPRLAAAAKVRGNDLSTNEALGVFAVEYFAHP